MHGGARRTPGLACSSEMEEWLGDSTTVAESGSDVLAGVSSGSAWGLVLRLAWGLAGRSGSWRGPVILRLMAGQPTLAQRLGAGFSAKIENKSRRDDPLATHTGRAALTETPRTNPSPQPRHY